VHVTVPIPNLLLRGARSRAPHDDGARIALCVEGGAMRGVVSAGMVSALEDLGLVHAFDAVYGSSAGAINAAYFLAGQAGFGTAIYSEDINNHQFISMRRAIGGRPIVDLASGGRGRRRSRRHRAGARAAVSADRDGDRRRHRDLGRCAASTAGRSSMRCAPAPRCPSSLGRR
jgi:hypothetical protein